MERRVVITGIGPIAPIGIGIKDFRESLVNGKSGIKQITRFNASSYPTRIAGEIDNFDPTDYGISPKQAKRMGRSAQFAVAAARMAVEDAQLEIDKESEVGVILGMSTALMDIIESQYSVMRERGLTRVKPSTAMEMIPNAVASNVAVGLGCSGRVQTISASCTAGLNAIGSSFEMILANRADVIIAGAAESQITPFVCATLCALGLTSKRNDEPEKASRPFDAKRDGGILSEGAGIVVLEALESALSRGAYIYGEIVGYSTHAGAYGDKHEPEFAVQNLAKTMNLALQDAQLEPSQVNYICAHAPSDEFDTIETQAIKRVLGKYAYELPISSIKSMIGNPLASAGPLQLIASIMALEKRMALPTINYEFPDPDCDLDYVTKGTRYHDVNVVLINSHGFGGIDASLVVRRLDFEDSSWNLQPGLVR